MSDVDLNDLATFVHVVERGSFAAAARELRLPTSTVSRAVTRLEAQTRVRLLQRTTRASRATAEGRAFYDEIAPALSALRAARRTLAPSADEPAGRLRVSAPSDLASSILAPVVSALTERYAGLEIEVSLSNAQVDLVAEGFDIALRAAPRLQASSLVARKVGVMEHRLYASPAYLARRGPPRSASDLSRHALVLFRARRQERVWTLQGAGAELSLKVRGRVSGDDFSFVRAMAVAGAGIALLPMINAAAEVDAGQLVRVLPALYARGATLYVVYPSAKNVPARTRVFRDAVIEELEAALSR
jgi:DNA-binding transcriptional LysR family regulator